MVLLWYLFIHWAVYKMYVYSKVLTWKLWARSLQFTCNYMEHNLFWIFNRTQYTNSWMISLNSKSLKSHWTSAAADDMPVTWRVLFKTNNRAGRCRVSAICERATMCPDKTKFPWFTLHTLRHIIHKTSIVVEYCIWVMPHICINTCQDDKSHHQTAYWIYLSAKWRFGEERLLWPSCVHIMYINGSIESNVCAWEKHFCLSSVYTTSDRKG